MGRTIIFVLALGAAVAVPVEGQSTIGVSAVIVEPVTAEPVHVQVRAAAQGLSVERAEARERAGSALLHRTYVKPSTLAFPEMGRRLPPGGTILVEESDALVITRVIAANS